VIEPFATDRLCLRPITLADVDEIVALDADPEVMRYINGGKPTPRDEAERIVARSVGHRWMACERDSDAPHGGADTPPKALVRWSISRSPTSKRRRCGRTR